MILPSIVVEAQRPSVVRRIDRNVYDIRDDPQAKTFTIIDILPKLPSVSLGPDGRLRLLGASGVRVLIDGKGVGLLGAEVQRPDEISLGHKRNNHE